MSEVKKKRQNLFTFWLDYKKALDLVPHEWLKQLDFVTTFSKDTMITFGEEKCAYQQVENGKLIKKHLKMNNLNIKPIKDSKIQISWYKYLGIDENISYVGTVNKERVMKEYLAREKKI